MTEAFYAIAKASFQGSIVILAVLALRLLLKKAPKSLFCLLWLLAGLRLALPFEIQSPFSLQPRLEETSITVQAEKPVQVPGQMGFDSQPQQMPSLPQQSPELPENDWEDIPAVTYPLKHVTIPEPVRYGDIAACIWAIGLAGMLAASAVSYFRLKRRVREAYLVENGCFECPGLETAFVLGFMPPKTYLPVGLSDREKAFIYDHENTHIARHDHWFKLLGYLVLSIHWFNPLAWLAYHLLCRDMELACDEHVVRNMTLPERKAYSSALLSCGSHTARIAACPVAFGESNPKKRIVNVLNYKKPTFWISLLAVVAVIFVSVCLLTSPENRDPLEQVSQALEDYQSKGSWHIQAEYTYENRPAATGCQMDIWQEEDRWYRVSTMELADGNQQTTGYVSQGDVQYTFFVSGVYHPEYRRWSLAEGDQRWYPYWLPQFELKEDEITQVREEKTEEGCVITTVLDPASAGEHYTQLYIRWHLDEKGNLTHVERYEQFTTTEDGETFLMGIHMDIALLPTDAETIKAEIDSALAEIPEDDRQEAAESAAIKKCRKAMIELQSREKLHLNVEHMGDPTERYYDYIRTEKGWLIEYYCPLWDLEYKKWLRVGNEQYVYDEDTPEDDLVTTPYYWQVEKNPEKHTFQLPYPFEQDWEYIELTYLGTETDLQVEMIHISNPENGSEFIFYFTLDGEFCVLDIDWKNASLEEAYTRICVRDFYDFVEQYYEEASRDVGKKPEPLDEEFYEELFTRQVDGAYAEAWVLDLFETFYREPVEFLNQLSRNHPERTDEILELMALSAPYHAEARFQWLLDALQTEEGVDQTLVAKLRQYASAAPMAKCADALEKLQAQGYWEIEENYFYTGGGVANDTSDYIWYISGDNLVQQNSIPEDGGHSEFWKVRYEGDYYFRKAYAYDDRVEEEWNTLPSYLAGDIGSTLSLPWPLRFDWENAEITYIATSRDGWGETISFSVKGDPKLQNGAEQEYTASFRLDNDGNLRNVELRYQIDNVNSVTVFITLRPSSREAVEDMIRQCHNEALAHTEES